MPLDTSLYFHTEGDGRFGETTPHDLGRAVEAMTTAGRGVIHLHGGMVRKQRALDKVERLAPVYRQAGAHPLFAVWETGVHETILNNLGEIKDEKIFRILMHKLLKWALGKLARGATKSAHLAFPNELKLLRARKEAERGEEPFRDLVAPDDLEPLDPAQADAFERELDGDPDFKTEVRAIVLATSTSLGDRHTARKAVVEAGDGKTRMNGAILQELRDDNQDGHKAVFTGLKLAKHAAKILYRVVERFVRRRDHGVYATVVEELLREVYLDDVGGLIWGSMKNDGRDTFDRSAQSKQPRGGWTLVDEIGRAYARGDRPPISIVAHSAGSIYACHLLIALQAARRDPHHPLPADFKLDNLVFLAPAARFDLFARTLAVAEDLFETFRMFTLRDELEAGYWEVPVLYPRSLLYFVSGVVERDGDDSHVDCPILGMERYYDENAYPDASLAAVRRFLSEPGRVVLSPTRGAVDASSTAQTHGAFDSDDKTLESVVEMLK